MKQNKKTEGYNLQKEYTKARRNLLKRVQRAENSGFDFPEDIIPSKPKKIRKESIERLNKLRGEYLYKKALSFQMPEGEYVTAKQGIKRKKEDLRLLNIQKSAKAVAQKKANRDAEQFGFGKRKGNLVKEDYGEELYKRYSKLYDKDVSEARLFEQSLSEEDYILLKKTEIKHDIKELGKEIQEYDGKGNQIIELGRDTRESVLPDEGIESESETEDETDYYSDEEREDAFEAEQYEKQQDDEKFRKWKERYKEQMNKPKKQRDYASEGEVVYAGIKDRLSQFRSDLNDEKFAKRQYVSYNEGRANSLERLLEHEIKIDGLDAVMRRLSGRGQEIDEAMQTMLYDSKQYKVEAAFNQLASIILGRALTPQESLHFSAMGEAQNYSTEDEDNEE